MHVGLRHAYGGDCDEDESPSQLMLAQLHGRHFIAHACQQAAKLSVLCRDWGAKGNEARGGGGESLGKILSRALPCAIACGGGPLCHHASRKVDVSMELPLAFFDVDFFFRYFL